MGGTGGALAVSDCFKGMTFKGGGVQSGDVNKINSAERFTKHALSALQFSDVNTARKCLQDALNALN
jgi:hypothetical protein